MNKKDVAEIRGRFKKSGCTFTKMCGCYINSEKEILVRLNETFLNLEEEEFYKYLELAKKTLSGTLGNNLLELDFPLEEESAGGRQQLLMGLRASGLKNEELLDTFYQLVIDNYEFAGNYLILLFHDAYDVMKKTKDNAALDESEEVYEYLLCAICPVDLTKPGLGYLEDENRIGPRSRDWAVKPPENGFLFPAFTERSADIHATLFYAKNAAEPHSELMEGLLGCPSKPTAAEQKNMFHTMIKTAVGDQEQSERIYSDLQDSLNLLAEEREQFLEPEDAPPLLTESYVQEILAENEVPEEFSEKIESAYAEKFGDGCPAISHLLDKKILAENEQHRVEKALVEQVEDLKQKLSQAHSEQNGDYDIRLEVRPEKVSQIKMEMIGGTKCIIIPVDENEQTSVNGEVDLL